MRVFGILAMPWLLWVLLCFIVMLRAGELYFVGDLVKQHNQSYDKQSNLLVGVAYSGPERYMKLHAVIHRKPDVLALGSSRINQIKGEFFKEPNKFYNASKGVANIEDVNYFLNHIHKDSLPKVLLLGLDMQWFFPSWQTYLQDSRDDDYMPSQNILSQMANIALRFLDRLKMINNDYMQGRFLLREVFTSKSDTIGILAISNQMGYYRDGHWDYGERLAKMLNDSKRFSSDLGILHTLTTWYAFNQEVSFVALDEFNKILQFCRLHNIKLVTFLMPYAPPIIDEIPAGIKENQQLVYHVLPNLLSRIAQQEGFDFVSYLDLRQLGLSQEVFLDGLHLSPTGMANMLNDLSNQVSLFNSLVNENVLREYLNQF